MTFQFPNFPSPPLSSSTTHFNLKHSWEGRNAYVIREGGCVRRCKIGPMDLNNGEVSILIEFHEKKEKLPVEMQKKQQQKTKPLQASTSVSPLALINTNILWLFNIIVSDDDAENLSIDAPESLEEPLPPLECFNDYVLTDQQKRKLSWMLKQVNNLLSLVKKRQQLDQAI